MWEEMYPEERSLTNEYESQGTFAMEQGQKVDGDFPLLPWHGPDNTRFTSQSVVDVTDFGYSYPEIPTDGSPEERRKKVATAVNKLYGRDSDKNNDKDNSSSAAASTGGTPSSAVSLSSTAEPSTTSDSGNDNARLPATSLPASDSISLPASVPVSVPTGPASGASSSDASSSETGAGDLSGIPSATLSGDSPEETGDKEDDKEDGGLDLPSFGELPGLGGDKKEGEDNGDGFNMTDLFPPIPDDLVPDLPDLDIGIDIGIEYMIRITIQAGKIPTPSEMNVYIGEKFAGSFVVLTAPPSGCIEGEFPIRKVMDVLGLLGGLISDLIHGKIQNPIDAIKDDINVEFVHVRSPSPTSLTTSRLE